MKLKIKTIWTKVLEKDQIKIVNDIMKEDIVKLVGYYEGDKVKDTSTKDILLEFIKEQRTFNSEQKKFNAEQRTFNSEQKKFNAEQRTFNGSVALFMKEQKEFNAEQKEFNTRIETKVDKNSDGIKNNSKSIEKLFNITSNMAEFVGYKIK